MKFVPVKMVQRLGRLSVPAAIVTALLLSCSAAGAAPRVALDRLPLAFEPNRGQAPADVRFVSHAAGYHLWLGPDAARFASPRPDGDAGDAIRLRWIGGATAPAVVAEHELPGKAHYYAGRNPSRWLQNVPTYARVAYRDVYPGIDLVFHGTQRDAEFDFVVRPGADPRVIALEITGADGLALQADDLVASRGDARLRLHKPVVFQEGPAGRVPVAGRFRLQGRRIAFEVGAYDPARPLVIDPVVTYSTYFGTPNDNGGKSIGIDTAENMYVALAGRIVKLSANGETVLYSTTIGDARPVTMAVDAAGRAYVASRCPYPRGGFEADCPFTTTLASGQPQSQGDTRALVSKLSPTGTVLGTAWIGGFGSPEFSGIAVGPDGTIYITGWNASGGFAETRPPFGPPGATGGMPAFVQRIKADLSGYVYAVTFRTATSSSGFVPSAIAVDSTGAAYVTGMMAATDFPTTPGAFQPTTGGDPDGAGAIVKITPDASALAYATFFGTRFVSPMAITVDGAGNAYIAGHATRDLPTANAIQPAAAGGADAFVSKLNTAGAALVVSTYLGGGQDDAAVSVALDSAGTIYVAGATDSRDFPQRNALPSSFGGAGSNFVTALNPAGNAFVYSTYFADAETFVASMTAAADGTVFLTGTTSSTSYPTVRPIQPALNGSSNAFIARIEPGNAGCVTGQFFAEYFANVALTPPAARTACESTIDNDWGGSGPAGLPADNVSVRWTGRFQFTGGNVTFTARADDGIRVFLDGALIIDQWRDQPATTHTATRAVTAGEHEVRVEYYERGGAAVAKVSWGGSCATGQFFAQYFANVGLTGTATRTACEATINNDYGAGGPAGLPADNFSARWTGRFTFAGGNVTFTARADDGIRLFLDGAAVIDQWHDQGATTYTATRAVTAGEHEVKVEYYERGGAAIAQVGWTGATTPAPAPAPTLTTLTPSRATAGGPAVTLTADGTRFVSGATVLWNGAPRTTTFVNATRVTASIPASDIAAAGSAAVTVRNPDGQASGARTFTINGPGGGGNTIRVFITAPANGATVSGTVWFTVWIENAAAGSKTYTLSVDGATITSAATTSNGPVSMPWSTAAASNGSRTATVTVRDSAGATGTASITLTVSN